MAEQTDFKSHTEKQMKEKHKVRFLKSWEHQRNLV